MDEGGEQDTFWGINLEPVSLFHFLNQESIKNRLPEWVVLWLYNTWLASISEAYKPSWQLGLGLCYIWTWL